MSESSFSDPENMSREELMSALFASMVMQQSNMAMLYLGQVPHPETGQPVRDLDAAQMFIQQLEMLEAKTKGNLGKEEASLLKHSLSSVRMAFVQTVKDGEKVETPASKTEAAPPASPAPDAKAEGGENAGPPSGSPSGADEERKKFVKKY
jgi:Domain of unknown function (DUF1844)